MAATDIGYDGIYTTVAEGVEGEPFYYSIGSKNESFDTCQGHQEVHAFDMIPSFMGDH